MEGGYRPPVPDPTTAAGSVEQLKARAQESRIRNLTMVHKQPDGSGSPGENGAWGENSQLLRWRGHFDLSTPVQPFTSSADLKVHELVIYDQLPRSSTVSWRISECPRDEKSNVNNPWEGELQISPRTQKRRPKKKKKKKKKKALWDRGLTW